MENSDKKIFLIVFLLLTGSFLLHAQTKPVKQLDFFESAALQYSPLQGDLKNQLLSNRIDSMRLKAGYHPQVSASSTGLYAPIIKGYGYDDAITNGQSLDALLNVNYNLNSKGLKQNQYKALSLQRDSVVYAFRLSELDLRKAVTEQYITAYASQQQLEFNQEVNLLLKKEEAVLKTLTRANAYTQTEYLTFLVTLKQQELSAKQAALQFKADYALLNYICGINDTTSTVLKTPDFAPKADVLAGQSFFNNRFIIDSLKAENDKSAIAYNYKPKLSVYANGGYNSSFVLQPYKNFGTSAGFTLTVPLYDGHQRKMLLDKTKLQQQTSTYYRSFFNRQHQQQLDMLKQQISDTDVLYKQITDQIRFTRQLITVDNKLLQTGNIRIADFVIAINNYLSAQNAFRQTTVNRLKLMSQLHYWNR